MKEMTISMYTAAKMLCDYYKCYYFNEVDVKVKPKKENNDLYMIVKIISVVNHKKIVEKYTLNQGEIANKLSDYMEMNYCKAESITFEPYFHNINIKYFGELENIDSMKPSINMQRVYTS